MQKGMIDILALRNNNNNVLIAVIQSTACLDQGTGDKAATTHAETTALMPSVLRDL